MIHTLIASLNQWDDFVCIRLSRWGGRNILDRIMVFASRMGNGYLYPAICLAVSAFDFQKAVHLAAAMLGSFAIELPIQKLLKHKTKRARPFTRIPGMRNLVKPPADFSFPSGHTAAAFLTAIQVSHFYPHLLLPSLAVAGIIGLSRIYNGVHYPSDVLAGMVLGIMSAETVLAAFAV
jgi:undecaprenyl-diphosphatase